MTLTTSCSLEVVYDHALEALDSNALHLATMPLMHYKFLLLIH